ncbi:ParB/RepB/Spo0J family partition protein [Staphylococcus chromogenes]|nr:ParB/RepB/Spo0J family partition protein [Staphylococcus chromogenes]
MANETRKGGLGRGLASLIPNQPAQKPHLTNGAADIILGAKQTPVAPAAPSSAPAPTSDIGASYREIPVHLIDANPRQPRQVFDPDALDELVHSIKEFGLLQPIVVRPRGERFELIMGERRWRATQRAGLKTIPAIVRETEDGDMLRDALLENIHRAQLNPLEEAAAYQQLLEEFGVSQTELADRIGRSRPLITNMIRLLALPVPVQRKVAAGVLSAGHARALLGLKTGADAQEALASRIVAEGMSVRATEEAVTLLNRGEGVEKRPRAKAPVPEFASEAASRLGDRFDTRVQVQVGKRKGKIVLEFGDREDLERILGLLEG